MCMFIDGEKCHRIWTNQKSFSISCKFSSVWKIAIGTASQLRTQLSGLLDNIWLSKSWKCFSVIFRKHLWNQTHIPTDLLISILKAAFLAPFFCPFPPIPDFRDKQPYKWAIKTEGESQLEESCRTQRRVWSGKGGLSRKEMRHFLLWSGSPSYFLMPALGDRPWHLPLLSTVLTLKCATVKALCSARLHGLAIGFCFVSRQAVLVFPFFSFSLK